MQFVRPIGFFEALLKLGSKSVITSALSSSEWSDAPAAARDSAFFSSRVESARMLNALKGGIHDFLSGQREELPNGAVALKTGSRSQFVDQMQKLGLRLGLGPLDPKDKGTIKDITSESRLSLIFNIQTQSAQGWGNHKQGMDPDVLNEFPAQRFIRVMDVNEPRAWHTQFEDQVRLKTDTGYWTAINADFGVPWAPWGWGCGHDVEDVDRTETEELGLLRPGQTLAPVEVNYNDNLQASTRGMEPELVDKLKDAFGDQVAFAGDTMSWRQRKS
jgi:hypothetical protein